MLSRIIRIFHDNSNLSNILAAQFQQSWAYANNVNLLAANVNWPKLGVSGSGIYAGRLGTLNVFVSEFPVTKILIARVPTTLPVVAVERGLPKFEFAQNAAANENLPTYETFESSSSNLDHLNEISLGQGDLTEFNVQFLDFSKELSQNGTVCSKDICCSYDINVSDHGEQKDKVCFLHNY